ncbi:MAG: tetratricopeptide repeat protein [Smithella sp.]
METKTSLRIRTAFSALIITALLTAFQACTNTNELIEKGCALGKAGNYQEAIEAFTKAIKRDSHNAKIFYYRGFAYYKLGDNQQAIQDYTKAIELKPDNSDAYNLRGLSYRNFGNNEQAIQDYNRAIGLNEKNAGAFYNRGIAYLNSGNYQQAIQDFAKVTELKPIDSTAFNGLGLSYYNLGNYKQAIQNYDKAIKLNPNYEYNYLRSVIAAGYLSKNERKVRLEILGRYVRETGSDAWVRSISMYYLGKISKDRLLAEAKKGKDDKDSNGRLCEAYYYMGEAMWFDKDKKGALDCFKKSLETGINNYVEYNQAKILLKKLQ